MLAGSDGEGSVGEGSKTKVNKVNDVTSMWGAGMEGHGEEAAVAEEAGQWQTFNFLEQLTSYYCV